MGGSTVVERKPFFVKDVPLFLCVCVCVCTGECLALILSARVTMIHITALAKENT